MEPSQQSRRVRRPRYADVMSTLAVVLALAGTSYAAGLGPNSVKSKQIKNNAVKSVDVKDGNLLATDFKAGELKPGPAGPAGAPGQKGQTGATGATGATGPTYGKTRTVGFPTLGTPENFVAQTDFTLPTAGPVFITAMTSAASTSCSSATTTVLGVTIDGALIPGTTRDGTSGVNIPFSVSGVSASLSAGSHTASIAATCAGAATSNGMSTVAPSISVILLGSS